MITAFDDLAIKATSGGIVAALPSEPGYRANVDITSGNFDYSVALSRDGALFQSLQLFCGHDQAMDRRGPQRRFVEFNGKLI